MKHLINRRDRAEKLFQVMTSERFLTKQGLGNEVPFFIYPYPASEGLTVIDDRQDLVTRVEHAGVKVV